MPVPTFSDRLKKLMDQRGLKQADLVKATGESRQTVNGWFTKGKVPKYDKLPLIAKVLGVSVDTLLNSEPEVQPIVPENPLVNEDSADYWKNKYIQVLEEKNRLLEEKNQLLQKQSVEQAKTIKAQKA